jgi:hypothetical protein
VARKIHQKIRECRVSLRIRYDANRTDPDSLAEALNAALRMVLSTPSVLDNYGDSDFARFGGFEVDPRKP